MQSSPPAPEPSPGITLTFLRLDLLAVPEAVPELRRAVRAWLDAPCADVQLCVTELVSNVIRHVGSGLRYRSVWPARVRTSASRSTTPTRTRCP
ncbi:hypothetical protein SHKM778_88100 [Streptomyces sp. KM77-8]|uniref:ATP-binding protein n=1 Tax=Streptomyces haneummycinicus TaxID=3074435 RepID=A0AAT9HZA2_9ACTN